MHPKFIAAPIATKSGWATSLPAASYRLAFRHFTFMRERSRLEMPGRLGWAPETPWVGKGAVALDRSLVG